MELKQPAAAGTLESGDILIELEPNEGKGLTIRLDSTVANQFGKRIKEVISETFAEMGVKDKQIVCVKIDSDGRKTIFGDVVIRVSDKFSPAMHIDTDESNAAGCVPGMMGEVITDCCK